MIDIGLLILRVTTGVIIAGHGAQRLFGWFGGRGFEGQSELYASTGLQPGWLWATLNGLVEFGGGILLTLGGLTPIAAGLLLANMVMAVVKVHWKNGLWNRDGGFEYPLTRLAANPGKSRIDSCGRYGPLRLAADLRSKVCTHEGPSSPLARPCV